MAFTTPFCKRPAEWRILLLALLLTGCAPRNQDFGFSIERIDTRAAAGMLSVVVHQKLVLSREAKNALVHGVPLSVRTEVALRPVQARGDVRQDHRDFEIRYLPLSERYQLTTTKPFSVQTYPRLRHVLAELSSVSFSMPQVPRTAGELKLHARSLLDKRHMPPPMRLPVWFSSQWQLDSGWRTWSLDDSKDAPGSIPSSRPSDA